MLCTCVMSLLTGGDFGIEGLKIIPSSDLKDIIFQDNIIVIFFSNYRR